MKIIALEEHMVTPAVLTAWSQAPTATEDHTGQFSQGILRQRLVDVGEGRIADMDDEGVDVQVLSLNSPGAQNLPPADAVACAREANDAVAAALAAHPDRFQAFAALPTPDPEAAIDELRRCVHDLGLRAAMLNGRTGAHNIDDPAFGGIYAAAAELRVPLYLHPQLPQVPVRETYYWGLGDPFDAIFASYGLGWHFETGVQLLRLIYAGTFDRHPDLQVIVGHWGELVLFFAERIRVLDEMGRGLDRPLADYLKQNVYYTGSGIQSQRYLQWTIDVVGVERIMYATDYPYLTTPDGTLLVGAGAARAFLEQAPLRPEDTARIASGNWEALMGQVLAKPSPEH